MRNKEQKTSNMDKDESLKEWAAHQPLSILRLDAVDRAILKIAGK